MRGRSHDLGQLWSRRPMPRKSSRRPALTAKVLRGLSYLVQHPGMQEAVAFGLGSRQRAARKITKPMYLDARHAKNWLEARMEWQKRKDGGA